MFGSKLRNLRKQHKLTQTILAQSLGLRTQSHIANLESGEDVPSLSFVLRVAALFDVTMDYLLRDAVSTSGPRKLLIGSDQLASVFGHHLKQLRTQRGWSQTDLAHHLPVLSRPAISNLEAGRKQPSIEAVVAVAELFEVSVDDLLVVTSDITLPPK